MIVQALAACEAPAPEGPGVRIERAVALDRDRAWVDLVDDAGLARRCRTDGRVLSDCVERTPGPSGLRRLGEGLVEERTSAATSPPRREAAWVDADTGRATAPMDLGFALGTVVAGDGALLGGPDGWLLAVTNRGLVGAPTLAPAEDPARLEPIAAFAVEGWEGGELRWRRAVAGLPGEAWVRGDRLAVHASGRWRLFDVLTGVRVAEVEAVGGACVDEHRIHALWGAEVLAIDWQDGSVVRSPFVAPGWVASCAMHAGAPVFHGGTGTGDGWLAGPVFPVLGVPRVDLALHDHVTPDGRWWLFEAIRGLVVVDPRTREVGPRHDAVHALLDGRLWFEIAADATLEMTLGTHTGHRAVLPARITPVRDHVVGDLLWTFPLRAPLDGPTADRFALPELEAVP